MEKKKDNQRKQSKDLNCPSHLEIMAENLALILIQQIELGKKASENLSDKSLNKKMVANNLKVLPDKN